MLNEDSLCLTVEVSLCWEQHSLQAFPHTLTLQSLLTFILGKRSHSFHKFKAVELFPAKQTEPGWKRRTGQAHIKVRLQCNCRRALHIYVSGFSMIYQRPLYTGWTGVGGTSVVNMKLCQSFLSFNTGMCPSHESLCFFPDRWSEALRDTQRVHSLCPMPNSFFPPSGNFYTFVLSPSPFHWGKFQLRSSFLHFA